MSNLAILGHGNFGPGFPQQKRNKPLIARAEALRESILPNLEKTADSKDHRFEQELLYATRDYLIPMLKESRGKPTEKEKWFEAHMKLAKRMLDNPGDDDIRNESAMLK